MLEQEIIEIMRKLRSAEPMDLDELQIASAIGFYVGKVESHEEDALSEMAQTLGIDITGLTNEQAAIKIVAYNSNHA